MVNIIMLSVVPSISLVLLSSSLPVRCQQFIAAHWEADHTAVRVSRFNRNLQDPGSPCHPSPCGPNTECMVNNGGNPICRCVPGFTPAPDTITGCKPECVIDPDCRMGYVCRANRCAAKPDPCQPNPCGPGAQCNVNPAGNAICTCEPGLIPKPDTITGCGPECIIDPDCQRGYICQSQRCVVKPDPCDPSPCGPGAECSVTRTGNAICRCQPGLIPNPDTISGCKPECVIDPDCQQGYICQSQRCVEKPDPCDPSPCGPGAVCTVNFQGNPICRCEPGLIPKPDTITGCGPECIRDPDCQQGNVCQSQRCVPRPDPCQPSPCGPNTECMENRQGNPVCRCLLGFIPMPDTISGCKRECEVDRDCGAGNICDNYRCAPKPDPCDPSPCGPNTECSVNRLGNPVCQCISGYKPAPDTITGCERNDPCDPNPCGPGAECVPAGERATCKCPAGYKGDPFVSCRKGDCEYDSECPASLACFNYNCKDPCVGTCGQNTNCEVRSHRPICSCVEGFRGDPLVACDRQVVIGGRQQPRQVPERSVIVIGQQYSDTRNQPEVVEARTVVGSRYGGGSSVVGASSVARSRPASGSQFTVVGAGFRRK